MDSDEAHHHHHGRARRARRLRQQPRQQRGTGHKSYWYQLGQDIAISAYDVPASSINTSNTGGNPDAPITALGWCADLVYNPQPQEVCQYTNEAAKGLSKTNTVAAQESRWLDAGCESQFNGWAG